MMRIRVVLPLPLGPTRAVREPPETVRFTESRSFLSPKETETPERLTRGIGFFYGDWLKNITTGEIPIRLTTRPWIPPFATGVRRSPPAAALYRNATPEITGSR